MNGDSFLSVARCLLVLTVLRAFPCRTRLADKDSASAVEEEVSQTDHCSLACSMYHFTKHKSSLHPLKHYFSFIHSDIICWFKCNKIYKVYFSNHSIFTLTPLQICQNLFMRGLSLVGWYHSHPRGPALPSLQDIDSQMEHQLKLQGSNNGFQPCLGIICGKHQLLYLSTLMCSLHVLFLWIRMSWEFMKSETLLHARQLYLSEIIYTIFKNRKLKSVMHHHYSKKVAFQLTD